MRELSKSFLVTSDISNRLRAEVSQRAGHRCEYCLISEDDAGFSHQVDHIVSRKHGGLSTQENLAYACVECNRHKGSDVASIDPDTGEAVPLFYFIRGMIDGPIISAWRRNVSSRFLAWEALRNACFG